MSPEQVNGQKIDARSDVFSPGGILYELLTGKKPFTGETMSALMFAIMKGIRPALHDRHQNPHRLGRHPVEGF